MPWSFISDKKRQFLHELNTCEESLFSLQDTLQAFLRYTPTEEERPIWAKEVCDLLDDIISHRDTLTLIYRNIKQLKADNAANIG